MENRKDVVGDSGLEENLQKTKKLLMKVKATLKDAEMWPIREEGVRLWLCDLRDLALEMEDSDDLFQYQVLAMEAEESSREVIPVETAAASTSSPISLLKQVYYYCLRYFQASSSPPVLDHSSFLKEMEDRLNDNQKRFDEIAKQKEALFLPNISEKPSQYVDGSSRQTGSSMVNQEKFIGRDEKKKEILEKLIGGDANPNEEVIALVGMGGIGKTTLCQRIYKDSEVMKHFDLMGWIHVGECLDVLRVTNNILAFFTREDVNCEYLGIVQEKLRAQVEGKRLLLVMDDVWCQNTEDWETVLAPLLNNEYVKRGCKILVTTRHHEVAQAAGVSNPIQLNRLSPEDGWCLFRNHVGNRLLDGHDELVDIGKEIVAKCDGLPLAIKVMGSLMRSKGDDVEKWREIVESDFSNIEKGRTGILGPLYLSYLHLPPHLKACFKFFSFIGDRKGGSLEKFSRKLIDIWLAHDLVGDEKNCSFIEQGIKLIGEFKSRSFIERAPDEMSYFAFHPIFIFSGEVHDLIFDLAQFVLDREICKTDHSKADKSSTPPTDARNLTINYTPWYCNDDALIMHVLPTLELEEYNYIPSSDFYPKLRYLHVVHAEIQQFHFRHLRVLCIEYSNMEEMPDSLYKLFNLRKLELIRCKRIRRVSDLIGNLKNLLSLSFLNCWNLTIIPESVSKLSALEDLKLRCSSVEELPDGITRLANLRNLNLEHNDNINYLPDGITRLANLRYLNINHTRIRCLPDGVTRLANLRYLNVEQTNIDRLPDCLSDLKYLRHLPFYPFSSGDFYDRLNSLNKLNLKGTLSIKLNVESLQVEESTKVEIGIDRKQLRRLCIQFPRSLPYEITDASKEKEAKMLEYLKPRCDIREIKISGFRGSRFPLWMGDQSFHQLVSMELECINWCETLSPLQQLPSLEKLYIDDFFYLVKLLPNEEWGLIRNTPHSEQKLCFPKLQTLGFQRCNSMRFLPLYQLTALQRLTIYQCSNLESIEFVDPSSSPSTTEEHHDRRGHPSSLLITEIDLWKCPNLCFSRNNNVVPPQSLEIIRMVGGGCQKLSDWCRSNPDSKWTNIVEKVLDEIDPEPSPLSFQYRFRGSRFQFWKRVQYLRSEPSSDWTPMSTSSPPEPSPDWNFIGLDDRRRPFHRRWKGFHWMQEEK